MEWLERVEMTQYWMEKTLSRLEESCHTIRAAVERTDTRTVEMAMLGKVCVSFFMLSFYTIVYAVETVYFRIQTRWIIVK